MLLLLGQEDFTIAVDALRSTHVNGPPVPTPYPIMMNDIVGLREGITASKYFHEYPCRGLSNVMFFLFRVGDDNNEYLQLLQKAYSATEPIVINRSGKYIFEFTEAKSTKGAH